MSFDILNVLSSGHFPYPAIESLFEHLPIYILTILHEKFQFPSALWNDKLMNVYGLRPNIIVSQDKYRKYRKNQIIILACIYAIGQNYSYRILWCCSEYGHFKSLKLLINCYNIAIDDIDLEHTSILQYAAEFGHYNIAKFLIDRGANVNHINSYGETPLHYAIKGCYKQPYYDIIKLLVDNDANIHIQNRSGDTPLDFAMDCNKSQIVELLICNIL